MATDERQPVRTRLTTSKLRAGLLRHVSSELGDLERLLLRSFPETLTLEALEKHLRTIASRNEKDFAQFSERLRGFALDIKEAREEGDDEEAARDILVAKWEELLGPELEDKEAPEGHSTSVGLESLAESFAEIQATLPRAIKELPPGKEGLVRFAFRLSQGMAVGVEGEVKNGRLSSWRCLDVSVGGATSGSSVLLWEKWYSPPMGPGQETKKSEDLNLAGARAPSLHGIPTPIEFALMLPLESSRLRGKELRALCEASVGEIAKGTFYVTLERAAEKGWVKISSSLPKNEDGRSRIFALTQAGRNALNLARETYLHLVSLKPGTPLQKPKESPLTK